MSTLFASTRTVSIKVVREWLATVLKINKADPSLDIMAGIVGHSIDFISECADKRKMPTAQEASAYIASHTLKIISLSGSSMVKCVESVFEVSINAAPTYRAVTAAVAAGGLSNPIGAVVSVHALYASLSLALAVMSTYENCSEAVRRYLKDAKIKYLNELLLNQHYRVHLMTTGRDAQMIA